MAHLFVITNSFGTTAVAGNGQVLGFPARRSRRRESRFGGRADGTAPHRTPQSHSQAPLGQSAHRSRHIATSYDVQRTAHDPANYVRPPEPPVLPRSPRGAQPDHSAAPEAAAYQRPQSHHCTLFSCKHMLSLCLCLQRERMFFSVKINSLAVI